MSNVQLQQINEDVRSFVEEANQGQRGLRVVPLGVAFEIARRSFLITGGETFSVRRFRALSDVSDFVSLAQKNKVTTLSANNADLLPVAHPASTQKHRMSQVGILRAQARWFADDARISDSNVSSLLATLFTESSDTPEYAYAAARLSAMTAGGITLSALVAVALGFNDGANRGYWRQQIRDRMGQWAKMFGLGGFKIRKADGKVYRQYGQVVSTDVNNKKARLLTRDGRIVEASTDALSREAEAILPSAETPDGVSAAPVRSSSEDIIIPEAELTLFPSPAGFDSVDSSSANFPNGLDAANVDEVWQDDLGNFQAVKGNFRDGEGSEFVVSRLEGGRVVPIGAGKDWADVQRIITKDEPDFKDGKDAVPDLPEGLNISPSTSGVERADAPSTRKSLVSAEEIQGIKEQSLADYVSEQGRFPLPRNATNNFQEETSDVAQAAKRDYQKVYDLLKEQDPAFGDKYPEMDDFWGAVKEFSANEKFRAYDSVDEIPDEVKQFNRGYAEAVLGMDPDGEVTLYRNTINKSSNVVQAGTGYWSTDKEYAQDYGATPENIAESKQDGSFLGFYEGRFRPDQIGGMLGYSRTEDEFALVVGPDVAGEEGRISRLGPIEPPELPDWLDPENKLDSEKRTGGSAFRQFALAGALDLKKVDNNPMGDGKLADFFEANSITKDDWAAKYDALWGEGAYAEAGASGNNPSFGDLQKSFVQGDDGKWFLDVANIDAAQPDSLNNPYYGEGNPANFKNDKFDAKMKMLGLVQDITGDEFMSPKQYDVPETDIEEPSAPDEVAELPEGGYRVDRGPYEPRGAAEGVESENYTDDPADLAVQFTPEELGDALKDGVDDGTGVGRLEFGDDKGTEDVPAEALYNALKAQGVDADQFLDDVEAGKDVKASLPRGADIPGLDEPKNRRFEDAKSTREIFGDKLPALLQGLSDRELQSLIEQGYDFRSLVDANRDRDVPEGFYPLNNDSYNPLDPIPGAPDDLTPFQLALEFSPEQLENQLREAITPDAERSGYGKFDMPDSDGELRSFDAPAEAITDALKLHAVNTDELLDEIYGGGTPTDEEIDDMIREERLREEADGGEPSDTGGPGADGEVVPAPGGVDGRGDRDGESPWSSLDNQVPESAIAESLREQGYPTPEVYELNPEQDADTFVEMMEGLKENNKYAASVFIYDVEEYREMRLFATADGTAGFGLKPNGDIVSVYTYGDSPHRGGTVSMLSQAVELGGDRLDAFDTILPEIYARAGFRPISRVRWDKDEAPDGWEPEIYAKYNKGEPDVVAMAYDPDRVGSEYDRTEGEYFDDYMEAMSARDAFLDSGPEGGQPEVPEGERPFGEEIQELDVSGDLETQINDAVENQRELVFAYQGSDDVATDRLVRPIRLETNERTSNVNLLAVDDEGNFKKFTLSKMENASDAQATRDDVVGEDSAGDEIETDDASLPEESKEAFVAAQDKVIDEIYEVDGVSTNNVEDFGEQQGVDDSVTTEIIKSVEDRAGDEDEEPLSDDEIARAVADVVQDVISAEDAEVPSVEELLDRIGDKDSFDPDLIWQNVIDDFDGKVLLNGHIVVSSVMHGDRRYDVTVRRDENNNFHIYHRVVYPDKTTKVRELGGIGWQSTKALNKKIRNQIENSILRPKTTVNKNLKPENINTLRAAIILPQANDAFVTANGSTVSKGDFVEVVRENHSKFGQRAEIKKAVRRFSSDGYVYTDYLRVQYEDGEKNWIRSQSVNPAETPETAETTRPGSGVEQATIELNERQSGGVPEDLFGTAATPDVDGFDIAAAAVAQVVEFLPTPESRARVNTDLPDEDIQPLAKEISDLVESLEAASGAYRRKISRGVPASQATPELLGSLKMNAQYLSMLGVQLRRLAKDNSSERAEFYSDLADKIVFFADNWSEDVRDANSDYMGESARKLSERLPEGSIPSSENITMADVEDVVSKIIEKLPVPDELAEQYEAEGTWTGLMSPHLHVAAADLDKVRISIRLGTTDLESLNLLPLNRARGTLASNPESESAAEDLKELLDSIKGTRSEAPIQGVSIPGEDTIDPLEIQDVRIANRDNEISLNSEARGALSELAAGGNTPLSDFEDEVNDFFGSGGGPLAQLSPRARVALQKTISEKMRTDYLNLLDSESEGLLNLLAALDVEEQAYYPTRGGVGEEADILRQIDMSNIFDDIDGFKLNVGDQVIDDNGDFTGWVVELSEGGGINETVQLRNEDTGQLLWLKQESLMATARGEYVASQLSRVLGVPGAPIVDYLDAGNPRSRYLLMTQAGENVGVGDVEQYSNVFNDLRGAPEALTKFALMDVIRLGILDAVIANDDRHGGNFLVGNIGQYGVSGDEHSLRLIPIDHGLTENLVRSGGANFSSGQFGEMENYIESSGSTGGNVVRNLLVMMGAENFRSLSVNTARDFLANVKNMRNNREITLGNSDIMDSIDRVIANLEIYIDLPFDLFEQIEARGPETT